MASSPGIHAPPFGTRLLDQTDRATTFRIVLSRESAVNHLLLAYAWLTPLLIIPVAGMLGASDLLFLPAVAVVLLFGKLKHCLTPHLLMVGFLMLVGISLYQTDEIKYVVKWIRLIGITFPFFLAACSTVTLQQILRAFFWSGLVSILMGIGLWWFDVVLFAEEANQRIWIDSGESRVRAAGIFGNSGAFGALVAMWTVSCAMLTISQKRPSKLMLATVLLTAIIALVSSTSRASLFGIFAGLGAGTAFLGLHHLARRGTGISGSTISLGIFLIGVTVATLCFVVPQLMDPQWLEVTFSRFDPRVHQSSDSFLSGRMAIWKDYLSSMSDWGIFGVGYKQGHLHFSTSPHNQFLSLASESGVLCLGVFLLFVANVLSSAVGQRRIKPFESMMCIAIMATFLADGMGGEPLGSWQITPITMILIGICIRQFAAKDK